MKVRTLAVSRRAMLAGLGALPLIARPGLLRAQAALTRQFEGATLRVLMGSGGVWDEYQAAAEDFTAATGITFEYTKLGYSETYQKLILDVTSGTNAFDAYAFAYQWKNEIADYLADLTEAESIEGAPALTLDDYPGDVIDVYGRVGDKLVGLPILGDATMLVWNRKEYEDAGLDPSSPPTTWDQVVANAEALNASGVAGFSLPGGKSVQTSCVWMILFAAEGGTYFGENYTPQFDSEAGLRATKIMVERLQPLAPSGNTTWDFPEMLNGLTTGDAGQGMMWPGGFGTLLDPSQSATAEVVSWVPTPGASLLGGWSIGINDASPNRDAALLYAAWISSKEVQQRGSAPARASVLGDPELAAKHPQFPAILAAMSGEVTQFPPISESEQIVIIIYEELNAALSGEKTSEEAVASMQERVEAFVVEGGYRQ